MNLVVIGSINTDLVINTTRLPKPGRQYRVMDSIPTAAKVDEALIVEI